jgi:hypothetical protein
MVIRPMGSNAETRTPKGTMRMSRPPSARRGWGATELGGLLLILLGGAFLLRTAGIASFDWSVIWALLIVGVGLYFLVGALMPRSGAESSTTVPRDGTTMLDLDLGVGAGTFRVGGGASELVEVHSGEDDISSSVERAGPRTRVRIRQRTDWFPIGRTSAYRWDVRLAEDVPIALVLAAGAGDFTIDLRALRIVDAKISAGAAQLRLALPRPDGEVHVTVSMGAASLQVQVPPGVEARFATSGLLSVNGRNETPGFATARDRILVTVTGGAASLTIV